MKPRIFLGSSAERISTLEKVKIYLADIGDCKLWTNAFRQNKSGLDSLLRETKLSDFSVLLAMKDDILETRGIEQVVARDNVIFEFALFLGSTGLNRAFLLAEEGINLPSDLEGIVVSKFTLEDDKYNSLQKVCDEIGTTINAIAKGGELGFLPSTALAIGYYYNFIREVCDEILRSNSVTAGDKIIKVKEFKFHVIVPDNLEDDGIDNFKLLYNKKHALNSASTGSVDIKRGYPFVFKLQPPDQKEEDDKIIDMFDVPGTLNTIVEALKLYMPRVQVGESEEEAHLERRELNNFCKVLRHLISKNSSTRNNVIVHDHVVLD